MVEQGIAIDQIVTIDEECGRRNQVSGWYDFNKVAQKFDIPIHYVNRYDLKHPDDINFFKQHKFDVLVQGGWQRLFPDEVISSLQIGAIGVHGSADFLPRGRGRSPLNWSLIENRRRFLLHLFLIKPGVDDGDVIAVQDFDINQFDDIDTLYMKLSIVNLRMHVEFLENLKRGELKPVPQQGRPTYFAKRSEADGEIDWEKQDCFEIYNFVRAQTRPYPGAFALLDGAWRRIWKCQPFDTRITYPDKDIGTVVQHFPRGFLVNCRGGLLLVTDWEDLPSKPG
jgi:methionyl-tRNA formyltransferase